MKILLVRPQAPQYTIGLKNIMICEPLELEYIAGSIDRKHTVEILDLILENKLARKLKEFKPDILGTSSYITGINMVKAICKTAKMIDPGITTVVGGVHASLCPEDFKDGNIDCIIRGEGFRYFNSIIESLEKGEKVKPEFDSQARDFLAVDTDNLPLPRRELTEKYHEKYYYLFHQPVTIVKTSFGCPFRCNFCFCWELTGGKVYSRTPESVINELIEIKNKEIYIIDDTFFISKKHVMDIHDLIVKNQIRKKFLVYGHSGFIIRNPDVIKAWADIGLKACIIGLESPKNSELKSYNKDSTVEINTQAIKILQENKIDVYASFIIDPNWTRSDFRILNDYIKENKLFYIVLQPFTPIPGTTGFGDFVDFNIPREDYELYDMQHAVIKPALPEISFYREIRKIYIKTFFNPFRTAALALNTAPPVFSLKYLRLISGVLKIYFDLRKAHKHHDLLKKNR
jgi:hopanoid C-3 methylase